MIGSAQNNFSDVNFVVANMVVITYILLGFPFDEVCSKKHSSKKQESRHFYFDYLMPYLSLSYQLESRIPPDWRLICACRTEGTLSIIGIKKSIFYDNIIVHLK